MELLQVVCAVIYDQQGQYLICQRPEGKVHAGLWEFPGGKMERNEQAQEALHREIQEELGCTITIMKRLAPVTDKRKSIRLIPFLCCLLSERIELHEHSNHTWVTKDQILNYELAEADVRIARNLIDF